MPWSWPGSGTTGLLRSGTMGSGVTGITGAWVAPGRKQKRVQVRAKGSFGAALTSEAEAVLHRASASLLLPPDGTIVGQPFQVCPPVTNGVLRERTKGFETIPRPGPRATVQRRSVAIALDVLLPVHRP